MGTLSPCHPPPTTRPPPQPQFFSFLTPKSRLPPDGGTLTSQMPRLRSRALQGLPVGRGAAAQGSFEAVRFGALALGGGAPGFSLRLRGGRSMPPTQPRLGARAPGGLRVGRGRAQTSPQVREPDPRGTARAQALCAPAPAAQLLTMTSSHLPQSARTSPRVWGAGEEGCVRKFPPGAAGRCSPCTN